MSNHATPGTTRSKMIWVIGDIYFITSVVVAILFGMLAPDIQKTLHFSELQLGVLSSLFFLCYGVAQLFAGRLIDSVGPRCTLAFSALLASCGLFIFSHAESFTQAIIAQIFSGIGLSTSYIGALFLAGICFTPNRFPIIAGITQMSANLMAVLVTFGLVFSGALLLGFKCIMNVLAIGLLCVALLLYVVIQGLRLPQSNTVKKTNLWTDVKGLLRIPQFLLITIYFSTGFGVLLAFSNLWNIPDQLSYGHSIETASLMNAMLRLGGTFGAALSGWLMHVTKRGSGVAMFYSTGMFLASAVLIYGPIFSAPVTFFLLATLGFFFGGAILGFPLISQHIPEALRGTGFGLLAGIGYLVSAFLQLLVGILLGKNIELAASIEAIHTFKIALSPLPITLAFGSICSYWLRDK